MSQRLQKHLSDFCKHLLWSLRLKPLSWSTIINILVLMCTDDKPTFDFHAACCRKNINVCIFSETAEFER